MDELRSQDNGQAEGIVKMSEPKVFYYETEIEWTKEKEGQIKGPHSSRRECRRTAGVQGTRRGLVPRASLRGFAKHLLYAYVSCSRGKFQGAAGEFLFNSQGQAGKSAGEQLPDNRDRG